MRWKSSTRSKVTRTRTRNETAPTLRFECRKLYWTDLRFVFFVSHLASCLLLICIYNFKHDWLFRVACSFVSIVQNVRHDSSRHSVSIYCGALLVVLWRLKKVGWFFLPLTAVSAATSKQLGFRHGRMRFSNRNFSSDTQTSRLPSRRLIQPSKDPRLAGLTRSSLWTSPSEGGRWGRRVFTVPSTGQKQSL